MIKNIKQHFIDAKNLVQRVWKYKLVLVILALLVANIYQTFPIQFPSTTFAYEAKKETVIDIPALVEKYEQEEAIKAEREIKFRAIKRIYDELGIIVDAEQEGRIVE